MVVVLNVFSVNLTDMNDLPDPLLDRAFVYAVVRRILRSDDDASDATQDTLLLAHRHRDQFRGDAAVRTWLYRIAVTTALGALRKIRRSRVHLAGDQPLDAGVADHAATPEQIVAARELSRRAAAELARLGEPYRRVFELKADDWSERAIADELAISIANVKIRAHRARRQLQDALAGG